MNQMYVTMVARHFDSLKINLLCSIIDQRIEHHLPSLLLRQALLEEIEYIQQEEGVIHPGQKKAYTRVLRDANSYTEEKEMTVSCLDNNVVTCKSRKGVISGSLRYNFQISEEGPIRKIFLRSYKNDSDSLQYITLERENIIVCNDWDVLDVLFTCTAHEVKVIRKRVSMLLTLKEQVEGITEVL